MGGSIGITHGPYTDIKDYVHYVCTECGNKESHYTVQDVSGGPYRTAVIKLPKTETPSLYSRCKNVVGKVSLKYPAIVFCGLLVISIAFCIYPHGTIRLLAGLGLIVGAVLVPSMALYLIGRYTPGPGSYKPDVPDGKLWWMVRGLSICAIAAVCSWTIWQSGWLAYMLGGWLLK